MANRKSIAIIGTGISGLSAAWLLSENHDITVFERDRRVGGHSNTIDVAGAAGKLAVDTGFIVYNEATYPNLTALFAHLDVPTKVSDMSFSVSVDDGAFEYSGSGLAGLLAQKGNLLRPRFWSMLRDLTRFYREAKRDAGSLDDALSLGAYLDAGGYSRAFCHDHLLPMAAAIWSAPAEAILDYPAAAFLRFHRNHGLLEFFNRPQWRTVKGGSRTYVERLTRPFAHRIRLGVGVAGLQRVPNGVVVRDGEGRAEAFDHAVLATHADQALGLLLDASQTERRLLRAFGYSRNRAVLHSDSSFMPRRRSAWASWNHVGSGDRTTAPSVTYWMNALQRLPGEEQHFVTINPDREPAGTRHSEVYEHPLFDHEAVAAQRQLWSLQGVRNTWFCGAYFGAGFHEDGLQAGLAVAEQLGGRRRPWAVENESGRIVLAPTEPAMNERLAA